MTVKELVSKVAKLEGKRHQAKVGDVREIVAIVSEIISTDPDALLCLVNCGKRRAAKKGKK